MPFDRRDGSRRVERVSPTDRGIYYNLGPFTAVARLRPRSQPER